MSRDRRVLLIFFGCEGPDRKVTRSNFQTLDLGNLVRQD
jgi:hypothetical protein